MPLAQNVTAPHVFILTWCRNPDALYGSLLTFRTIRTGFPSASITVVDNASIHEARAAIYNSATEIGAGFLQLDSEIQHHDFITDTILRHPSGPVVFLDPDLCFWQSVEEWSFSDCLMAGRLLPAFQCEFTRTITHPRLHTSFLWIPDVAALRAEMVRMHAEHFEWHPFRPLMLPVRGEWNRWDSGAALYAAAKNQMRPFGETELNLYDHLFVGSHLDLVAPRLAAVDADRMRATHEKVKGGDLCALRGAWRWQQEMFERRAPNGAREKQWA